MNYSPITVRLRPPRFVLAYRSGSYWIGAARAAVAAASPVWGGGGVPVPVDIEARLHASLVPVLRQFDPDHITGLIPVIDDLVGADPDRIAEVVKKHALPGKSAENARRRIQEESVLDDKWDGLAEQVNQCCSPFKGMAPDVQRFEGQHMTWLSRTTRSTRQLASITPSDERPFITFDLSSIDPTIALMVESRIGAIESFSDLADRTIRVRVEEVDVPALINLAITGRPNLLRWPVTLTSDVPSDAMPTVISAAQLVEASPVRQALRATRELFFWSAPPVVCVVGDTAEDHALAMFCDRHYLYGAWIPYTFVQGSHGYESVVRNCLQSVRRIGRDLRATILLASISQPIETLTSLAESLNRFGEVDFWVDDGPPMPNALSRRFKGVTLDELVNTQPYKVIADDKFHSITQLAHTEEDRDGITFLTTLDLPEPEAADTIGPDLHWCVDVDLARHRLPAKPALGAERLANHMFGPLPETVIRSGRDGLTFLSANFGFATSNSRKARPLLRFPSGEVTLREIARSNGAQVDHSPAGKRAANAAELWGSYDTLVAAMDGRTRAVLNLFFPSTGKRKGDYGFGYAIRGNGYVAVEDVTKNLGVHVPEARELLDQLCRLGVLRRGLLLTCLRCAYQAFYRIENVASSFVCQACDRINELATGTWYRRDAEPHWYYALDQVVRELLTQNGDVTLLATRRAGGQCWSLLWSPELTVRSSGFKAEIDICSIIDGRIFVGEAKSNGKLDAGKGTKDAAQKLARAGKILEADEIVLATSTDTWASGTRAHVEEAVRREWSEGREPRITELFRVRPTPWKAARVGVGPVLLRRANPHLWIFDGEQ